jgi:hypothetical protein
MIAPMMKNGLESALNIRTNPVAAASFESFTRTPELNIYTSLHNYAVVQL